MSESETRPRTRRPERQPIVNAAMQQWLTAGFALVVLVASVIWLANLEQDLPDVRTPRDLSSSSVLPGHALMMPGTTEIQSVDADVTGDWVEQEIGNSEWIATDLEGSRIRAAFYGTDVYLLVRMGPDATRAYVAVNDQPVEHLAQDDLGSYVGLWSPETTDQPVLLARNLAHGEHVVEVVADGDGELAIAGFEVVSSSPFPWAFALGYIGLGGGLFMLVRAMLYAANRKTNIVVSGKTDSEQDANR